ncbi:MAG: SIMPL domain-containing protein [Rhodobacter sp.]|nr:SIMPL domain-containing protein [Rhodobacter sp.]
MRFWIAAAVLVLALPIWAQETAPGRLTVTGEGRVESVPDMATITLGVTSEARTAADAMRETSKATAAVLGRLASAGIEDRDMQTRDLSLSPVWDSRSSSSPPKIVGFQARNTVVVRVRALDALGGILDEVIEAGANLFQGLSFGLQEPGPVHDEARRRAVAEARRKAALYAEAAGLSLGAVLELNEAGGSPRPMMLERAAMASAVPIAAGEVAIQAAVSMVFEIR